MHQKLILALFNDREYDLLALASYKINPQLLPNFVHRANLIVLSYLIQPHFVLHGGGGLVHPPFEEVIPPFDRLVIIFNIV
jgi:hypothetical protein